MHCGDEAKCFTIMWRIDNFRESFSAEVEQSIRSSVCGTEGNNEGRVFWRLIVTRYSDRSSYLEFVLWSLQGELKEKDYRYKMYLLTSSGEVELIELIYHDTMNSSCCYTNENNTIFGEKSKNFLPQGRLTLCCRIWQPKLNPGRCLLQNVLQELKFSWVIKGFPETPKQSLYQEGSTLISMSLFKEISKKSTHEVRLELHPDCGKLSAFINCNISINNDCGQVVFPTNNSLPDNNWKWGVVIYPEKCKDANLHLEFDTTLSIHVEHQQFSITSYASPGSFTTLRNDLLQLYRKRTLSDVTLNTEGKSISAHRNILATRSPVFHAMFEKDHMIEGQSGVVDIDDIDSETMDRLLVFLYSDLLGDIQWEDASALYYAADKYAVLPLKQKCGEILMVALTADNVCDALVLADKHSDEQLMSVAVDVVRDHEEVISSPGWASLEESNSRLTSKVLRQVILKKAKK